MKAIWMPLQVFAHGEENKKYTRRITKNISHLENNDLLHWTVLKFAMVSVHSEGNRRMLGNDREHWAPSQSTPHDTLVWFIVAAGFEYSEDKQKYTRKTTQMKRSQTCFTRWNCPRCRCGDVAGLEHSEWKHKYSRRTTHTKKTEHFPHIKSLLYVTVRPGGHLSVAAGFAYRVNNRNSHRKMFGE